MSETKNLSDRERIILAMTLSAMAIALSVTLLLTWKPILNLWIIAFVCAFTGYGVFVTTNALFRK